MANACASAVRTCLASAGTWQTRQDLALALPDWSETRVDDELADLVVAGDVQFSERQRMYRLAGSPVGRAALQRLQVEQGGGPGVALVGRQTADRQRYRVAIARRHAAGAPAVVAELELPYPADGSPSALQQLVATVMGAM